MMGWQHSGETVRGSRPPDSTRGRGRHAVGLGLGAEQANGWNEKGAAAVAMALPIFAVDGQVLHRTRP